MAKQRDCHIILRHVLHANVSMREDLDEHVPFQNVYQSRPDPPILPPKAMGGLLVPGRPPFMSRS